MVKQQIKDFDIVQISHSGQCFRMDQIDEKTIKVIAYGRYLEVMQNGDQFTFSCTQEEFDGIWRRYFDLNTDYSYFKSKIDPDDQYMMNAAACGSGIRILNQEMGETIISFIISQQNNIPRIKKCIQMLSEKYGERKKNYKGEYYDTFPELERLALLDESELRNCGLGYRSRYIIETSQSIMEGKPMLSELAGMTYHQAKEELMKLSGIGQKVSDCICLFACHHIEAFPIDTHIKDVLMRHYKKGFPEERYQGFAGVMQQYAFYYEVHGAKQLRLSRGAIP